MLVCLMLIVSSFGRDEENKIETVHCNCCIVNGNMNDVSKQEILFGISISVLNHTLCMHYYYSCRIVWNEFWALVYINLMCMHFYIFSLALHHSFAHSEHFHSALWFISGMVFAKNTQRERDRERPSSRKMCRIYRKGAKWYMTYGKL